MSDLTPLLPGGFETIAAAFLNPIGWIALLAIFVVVATPWARFTTFGNVGAMNRAAYDDLEKAASQTWLGWFVGGAPLILFLLQVVRNVVLWLSWTFYLVLGPALTVSANFYLAVNSLILAGAVFHTIAEESFWNLRMFALATFLRFLEWAVFVGAFIAALIEFINIDSANEEVGTNLFLVIVLGIIVVHTTWLFVRNIAFQWAAGAIASPECGNEILVGSASSLQSINNAAAKQRAAQGALGPKFK